MESKAIVITFCALLLALGSLFLCLPKAAFSENENRYLAVLPQFSGKALFSGAYTAGLDTYVADHFPLRDAWVSLKTYADLAAGKRDSNDVYIAEDGYLIEMFTQLDSARYAQNLAQVQSLLSQAEASGIRTSLLLVPTASHVLADKLPAETPEIQQQALFRQAEAQGLPLVDVSASLLAHEDEYLYYRTDHHWTSLGAYYAYGAWAEAAGLPARSLEEYSQVLLSGDFYGTTFSKSGYYGAQPDEITAIFVDLPYTVVYNGTQRASSLYEPSHLARKDKYPVFLNGNQPVTKITGGAQNGRKLLIVKDSYANTFAQFAAADFQEVHLIDPRSYQASLLDYAAENGITDLLVLYNVKNFAEDTELSTLQQ